MVVGTGPFAVESVSPNAVQMKRNDAYYQERPAIERVLIKSFGTLRAAWAEMLRGDIDMLYEVDVNALGSLEQSSNIRVVTFPQNYAYVVVLNTHRAQFKDPVVRAALNAAVDRTVIVDEVFNHHGTPATGSVSPQHWAYDATAPSFRFNPKGAASAVAAGRKPLEFTCITLDAPPFDRIAINLQRQLNAVGVEMKVDGMSDTGAYSKRVDAGDFDAVIVRPRLGGNLIRPYQWWHSKATYNSANFASAAVDGALDAVRHSTNDDEYRAAVARFQRALFADPPAIFLIWNEGVRAVSTRFEVASEPGRDVLGTIRQWRPTTNGPSPTRN